MFAESNAKRGAARPLTGIKVLDLTEGVAGPYCSMQLGDSGADIIKVEPPPRGDWSRTVGPSIQGESALFLALNRNKKSIVIDMKDRRGKDLIHQLVRTSDVFIVDSDTLAPDESAISYETVEKINGRTIYCSLSALGESGPYSRTKASELEVQGMSWNLAWLGSPGEAPVRVGVDIAATTAGMHACLGILGCLFYRKRTGIGQKVETSMLRGLLANSPYLAAWHEPDDWVGPFASGPFDHPETGYRTRDVPIMWGVSMSGIERGKEVWADLCSKLGLEDLLADPWFAEHGPRTIGIGKDAQDMKPFFEETFNKKSAAELVRLINEVGGSAAPFNTYETLFKEPQVSAVDMVAEIEHPTAGRIRVTGLPWKFPQESRGVMMPPPLLGQHTREVLEGLGHSPEEIEHLRRSGTIAVR